MWEVLDSYYFHLRSKKKNLILGIIKVSYANLKQEEDSV